MYSKRSGLVIGFHGCDLQVRDDLVNHKIDFKHSTNPWDWLGWGAYFWENNEQRALDFTEELKSKEHFKDKIKEPAVLGAVLDLGYCLDLTDKNYLTSIENSFKMVETLFNAKTEPLPENKGSNGIDLLLRNLDCLVIENIHFMQKNEKLPAFDSVRSPFIEGDKFYQNAGFREKNHIQICIRNPNCIKALFIPRKEVDWRDNLSLIDTKYKHIIL